MCRTAKIKNLRKKCYFWGKNSFFIGERGEIMDDKRIIELFFSRDENAIAETEKKYGDLALYIASSILGSREDAEECVSDVMLALWNAIPPECPADLQAYIIKSVRNRALVFLRDSKTQKRGGGVIILGDELFPVLEDGSDLASEYESRRLGGVISAFLRKIGEDNKDIFVMRYFAGMSLDEISRHTDFSLGKIKMSLARTKKKLKEELRKEGFTV